MEIWCFSDPRRNYPSSPKELGILPFQICHWDSKNCHVYCKLLYSWVNTSCLHSLRLYQRVLRSPILPLHSWLVSWSLNPWGKGMSMSNSWPPVEICVYLVYWPHTGYLLGIIGRKLMPAVPLQPCTEALSGRGCLLLWTGLTWSQDTIPVTMFTMHRHGASLGMAPSAEAPRLVRGF